MEQQRKARLIRAFTVGFYFFLAIMFFATIGIWLPALIECLKDGNVNIGNLIQNSTTYFMVILAGVSLDKLLLLFDDEEEQHRKFYALGVLVINAVILIMSAGILISNVVKPNPKLLWLVGIGIMFSYIGWWLVKYKDPQFDEKPLNSIGGDPSNPLRNGR